MSSSPPAHIGTYGRPGWTPEIALSPCSRQRSLLRLCPGGTGPVVVVDLERSVVIDHHVGCDTVESGASCFPDFPDGDRPRIPDPRGFRASLRCQIVVTRYTTC